MLIGFVFVQDLFAAGLETTSTTLEWAMSELLRHPHVVKRLQVVTGLKLRSCMVVAKIDIRTELCKWLQVLSLNCQALRGNWISLR